MCVIVFVLYCIMFLFCYFAVPHVFHCTGKAGFIETPPGRNFPVKLQIPSYEKSGMAKIQDI